MNFNDMEDRIIQTPQFNEELKIHQKVKRASETCEV
jgi:hypothetical protein